MSHVVLFGNETVLMSSNSAYPNICVREVKAQKVSVTVFGISGFGLGSVLRSSSSQKSL